MPSERTKELGVQVVRKSVSCKGVFEPFVQFDITDAISMLHFATLPSRCKELGFCVWSHFLNLPALSGGRPLYLGKAIAGDRHPIACYCILLHSGVLSASFVTTRSGLQNQLAVKFLSTCFKNSLCLFSLRIGC